MHELVRNCSLQNFSASFSFQPRTALPVRASLLLPPLIPRLVCAEGTASREVNSGDALEEIIDLWVRETEQKREVWVCGGKSNAWFKKRYRRHPE